MHLEVDSDKGNMTLSKGKDQIFDPKLKEEEGVFERMLYFAWRNFLNNFLVYR